MKNVTYNINNSDDLHKIIEGCKVGDRKMQKALFESTYGQSFVIAMRYSKDDSTAKDIINEAYLKVFSKIGMFEINGSIQGWVNRIVINTAIDSIRRNKKIIFVDTKEISNSYIGDEENTLIGGIESSDVSPDDVIDIIQNLSPAYRTVFNMYVFDEMTHKQIAEALGITESTSKSNLFKARASIKNKILTLSKENEDRQKRVKELWK